MKNASYTIQLQEDYKESAFLDDHIGYLALRSEGVVKMLESL